MNAANALQWQMSPHSGGIKIPERTKIEVDRRLHACFAELGHDKSARLAVRFRGALCYVDAYREADARLIEYWGSQGQALQEAAQRYRTTPIHLGRLRHFDANRWSYAFYTYSNQRYEPSFLDGDWFGTPERCLEIGCVYLQD